jgi:hypothetical protein
MKVSRNNITSNLDSAMISYFNAMISYINVWYDCTVQIAGHWTANMHMCSHAQHLHSIFELFVQILLNNGSQTL